MSDQENLNIKFKEFEEQLMGVSKIKYVRDENLESSLRFDYLCDEFGFEKINNLFDSKGYKIEDLSSDEFFGNVKNELENI